MHVDADNQAMIDALGPAPNLSQAEILSSAGTYGDFSRYLQLLPGVVWNSDLSNEVLVRGGHPTENLFVVDGVEVPNVNHFSLSGSNGGFTSLIDSTAVGSMSMRDDVYDAGYASRLSSLIEIHTRDLGQMRQAGNFTAGISGVGGLFQHALANNGNILIAGHRSILNLVTNDIGINGVPTFTDGMAHVELKPSDRDSLSFFSLTGADSIDMTPCQAREATSNLQTQYSGWRTTQAISWGHIFSPRVTSTLIASTSFTQQNIGQQQQQGIQLVDGACEPKALLQIYNEDSLTGLSALKYVLRSDLHGWLISAGSAGNLTTTNDSVAQPVGQLSPFSADTSRSDAVTFHRNFSVGESAGFIEAERSRGTRWRLMAGLRAESFAINASYALDPRVSLNYRLNDQQTLHGSVSMSSQLPPFIDMISYASNKNLQPTQVRQETLGVRLWQANWGTLDA
ncbi:MAG: TonB-dependent receptor, partial [Terracidiphilus sp.]